MCSRGFLSPAKAMAAREERSLRCLRAATTLVFAYLCAGELFPIPVLSVARKRVLRDWQRQQVILISTLSCLSVLLGVAARNSDRRAGSTSGWGGSVVPAAWLLAAMNVVPVIAAAAPTPWLLLSEHCGTLQLNDECIRDFPIEALLEAVGLVSARLARLDLGVSLLLAPRGRSAWVFGATGGALGSAEVVALHRWGGTS